MLDRKNLRLKGYDYSQNGWYFITSCVQNRRNYFGKIVDGEIVLNKYGKIVKEAWLWLAKQYNYVNLDEFVVMPNHFHGIIGINVVGTGRDLSLRSPDLSLRSPDLSLRSPDRLSQNLKTTDHNLKDLKKIKSLSSLIGAFKTTSSKQIHFYKGLSFSWQRSFYDVII